MLPQNNKIEIKNVSDELNMQANMSIIFMQIGVHRSIVANRTIKPGNLQSQLQRFKKSYHYYQKS